MLILKNHNRPHHKVLSKVQQLLWPELFIRERLPPLQLLVQQHFLLDHNTHHKRLTTRMNPLRHCQPDLCLRAPLPMEMITQHLAHPLHLELPHPLLIIVQANVVWMMMFRIIQPAGFTCTISMKWYRSWAKERRCLQL